MFSRTELRLCTHNKYQLSSFTKPLKITMYCLQYYGDFLLQIFYWLWIPFYNSGVPKTHRNVINLLAVQLQVAEVLSYCDKHVSLHYIQTHEAKHNKHTNLCGNLTFPEVAGSFAKLKRQGVYKEVYTFSGTYGFCKMQIFSQLWVVKCYSCWDKVPANSRFCVKRNSNNL